MTKHSVAALAAAWMLVAAAWASDTVDVAAVGTARGKAEAGLINFENYADDYKSTWTPMWFKIDNFYNESNGLLNAEVQKESRKPDEARNTALIEQMQKKLVENQQKYAILVNQERNVIGNKLTTVRTQHNSLRLAFDQIPAAENSLKAAKADLGPLKALYEAVEKREQELQAQAKDIIDSVAKIEKEWAANVVATKALIGPPK